MRWVCKEDIEACLTQAWRDKASAALDELNAAANTTARKKILRKAASSSVWRDFYELLPDDLRKKCWYCEAEEIRNDTPVDHFRPKNKVDGVAAHDGYWWLAFDWSNYRCACEFCNTRRVFECTSGGKACKFPLVDPGQRAFKPADNLEMEVPDLLDPFDPDDEKLLWFDNDGVPMPKPEATPAQIQKVTNSIDIFHLDEGRIARARNEKRLEVNRQVRRLYSVDPAEVTAAKNQLRRMVRPTERLSRSAIVYLRQHRELDEVKEILALD